MVHRIALVRHGQSKFNLEKKFTGWTDINLTETGEKEAIQVVIVTDHYCLSVLEPAHVPRRQVRAGRRASEDRRI